MEDIVIREARDRDVARILELYREAGIEAQPGFTPQEAREQLALFLRYPSLRVFVAEVQGEVVGTFELLIMDNLAKRGRRSGVVEDVAVATIARAGDWAGDDAACATAMPAGGLLQVGAFERAQADRSTRFL